MTNVEGQMLRCEAVSQLDLQAGLFCWLSYKKYKIFCRQLTANIFCLNFSSNRFFLLKYYIPAIFFIWQAWRSARKRQ